MLEIILEYGFLQRAIWISFFSALLSASLGVYVVINHLGSFGGSVSHSLVGGIGFSIYLSTILGSSIITPLWGSYAIALLLPFLIEWLMKYDRSDSLLSFLWALGMSLGTIFISLSKGYQRDLMSYLFGNILLSTNKDIWFLGIFTLAAVTIFISFMPQILMLSFDRDWFFIAYRKQSRWFERGLLCLLSLGVVTLSRVVGIVLVISILVLPASLANLLTFHLKYLSILAFFLGLFSFWLGLLLSYLWDIPSGSTIVAILGFFYFLCIIIKGKSLQK